MDTKKTFRVSGRSFCWEHLEMVPTAKGPLGPLKGKERMALDSVKTVLMDL